MKRGKKKRMTLFDREKKAYIEVFLVVFTLLLFVIAHLLHTISTQSEGNMIWMGMNVDNLIVDTVLYIAVFLSFILIYLTINRNFNLKKKKEKKVNEI